MGKAITEILTSAKGSAGWEIKSTFRFLLGNASLLNNFPEKKWSCQFVTGKVTNFPAL